MADGQRGLGLAATLGGVAFLAALVWGFYIFAGIAISGYRLGSNGTADLLAVGPPLAAAGLLAAGVVIAARGFRARPASAQLLAAALILVEGTLGGLLLWYAIWAGTEVATVRTRRVAAREARAAANDTTPVRVVSTEVPGDTVVYRIPREDDTLAVRLLLVYGCRGDWRRASVAKVASGDPLPRGENVCLIGVDAVGPCPACERESPVEPRRRAIEAHRRWMQQVDERFARPHRLHVQIHRPRPAGLGRHASDSVIWLYGYRIRTERAESMMVYTAPDRDSLTVQPLAPYPSTERDTIDRWIEVPRYTDAVYGVVVAPNPFVARSRIRGIPTQSDDRWSCYDEPIRTPPGRWEVAVPPRLCLCCAQ